MLKRDVISKKISTFADEIIIVATIKNDHLALANLTNYFGTTIANAKVILVVSDNPGHLWTK